MRTIESTAGVFFTAFKALESKSESGLCPPKIELTENGWHSPPYNLHHKTLDYGNIIAYA